MLNLKLIAFKIDDSQKEKLPKASELLADLDRPDIIDQARLAGVAIAKRTLEQSPELIERALGFELTFQRLSEGVKDALIASFGSAIDRIEDPTRLEGVEFEAGPHTIAIKSFGVGTAREDKYIVWLEIKNPEIKNAETGAPEPTWKLRVRLDLRGKIIFFVEDGPSGTFAHTPPCPKISSIVDSTVQEVSWEGQLLGGGGGGEKTTYTASNLNVFEITQALIARLEQAADISAGTTEPETHPLWQRLQQLGYRTDQLIGTEIRVGLCTIKITQSEPLLGVGDDPQGYSLTFTIRGAIVSNRRVQEPELGWVLTATVYENHLSLLPSNAFSQSCPVEIEGENRFDLSETSARLDWKQNRDGVINYSALQYLNLKAVCDAIIDLLARNLGEEPNA
ncbi:MAG: hypothetical protein HQ596_01835 [Candidatus Saganbacteria bacterium]|nr:hypothetical protein [Candidatus Saganbacteria bacterium]